MVNGADKTLTPSQIQRILTDVAQIRAVLGC